DSAGDLFADWSVPAPIGILPSQAILLAGRAHDGLSVLVHGVSLMRLKGVFMLCFHVTMADGNRVQFVGTDAAVEEFLPARFGVKRPLVTSLHQRHRERPL